MRALPLVLLPLHLAGCAFGLSVTPLDEVDAQADPDTGGGWDGSGRTDEDDEGGGDAPLAPTSADLEGRVYSIPLGALHVVEPAGLGALLAEAVDRDLLVYVAQESSDSLALAAALAGADGQQDPCEVVRAFPAADWSQNPLFEAGPGVLEASFAGSPAQFRELVLAGVFDADGGAWRDGTLSAELDTRELQPALSEFGDLCALVAELGGACHACDDGADACFDLRVDDVVAEESRVAFDPSPECAR